MSARLLLRLSAGVHSAFRPAATLGAGWGAAPSFPPSLDLTGLSVKHIQIAISFTQRKAMKFGHGQEDHCFLAESFYDRSEITSLLPRCLSIVPVLQVGLRDALASLWGTRA